MIKNIIIFLIIFIIKYSKSETNCIINISLNTTLYNNNLCGYGSNPDCISIQDAISSLSNLANTQSCSSAQLNLNNGGTFMGKNGNYFAFGNYDQLKLNNIQTIQVNGGSGAVSTIIDGSGLGNKAFFSLTSTSQSLQFSFNHLNFQNWVNQYNLFDVEIENNNGGSLVLGMNFTNCNFTKIETSSIVNAVGSTSTTNYNLQFQNVNFNNIFTLFSPITASNSIITMINSYVTNVDNAIPFVNIITGTLKFYNCSININHPMMGENANVLFINTQVESTTLCHCENCIYYTSNENSINPTLVSNLTPQCPTKRFWIILFSCIGAAFIIVCFIVLFILNKKFGIIDIANKKRRIKSRKPRSYFQDDDDEQSSIFLNDNHL